MKAHSVMHVLIDILVYAVSIFVVAVFPRSVEHFDDSALLLATSAAMSVFRKGRIRRVCISVVTTTRTSPSKSPACVHSKISDSNLFQSEWASTKRVRVVHYARIVWVGRGESGRQTLNLCTALQRPQKTVEQ